MKSGWAVAMTTNSDDPYIDAESGVLRNLLGLTDADALQAAETDITFARIAELHCIRLEGGYDLVHLCHFHRHIFGDLYEWAGEVRSVDLTRTHTFARAQFIIPAASPIFSSLEREKWLRGLDRSAFVARLAHYLAEINALHPFREGNGRTQRAFFGQLARDAGFRIAWENLDSDQNRSASEASLTGDVGPVERMLDKLVVFPA